MVQTSYDYSVYIPPGYTDKELPLPDPNISHPMKEGLAKLIKEDSFDKLSFSEAFQKNYKSNGEVYSIDVPADAYTEPEPFTLRMSSPYSQQYRRCTEGAENGQITDYFFYLDASMIENQAMKVKNGEVYKGDPIRDLFIKSLNAWFQEGDTAATAESFDAMVNEYVKLLEEGKTPSMSQLKTTFSFGGEQVTISQMFEMRDIARALNDVDYGSSLGTEMHVGFAKLGMLKVAAQDYAKTLPPGLQGAFSERFSSMVENAYQKRMQTWKQDAYMQGSLTTQHYNRITQTSELAYNLFSSGTLSQSSVQANINKLTESFKDYYHPDSVTVCQRDLTDAYSVLKKLLA